MKFSYAETFQRFCSFVDRKPKDETMIAVLVDSTWLPDYAGISMLDFYFDSTIWLDVYTRLVQDLPGVVFLPGSWIEFGMAMEPSGWGTKIKLDKENPSAVFPFPGGLSAMVEEKVPDPETDGLMAIALNYRERMNPLLAERNMSPRIAATRGPLCVASHLLGVTELLMASQIERDKCKKLLENTTELCIRWLKAQLERMEKPAGIMVLDDVAGMFSPADVKEIVLPYLKRIFESFPGKIHIFHNDMPNANIYPDLATTGIDVFNFSYECSIEKAREKVGPDVILMGNIPPLDVLARGSADQVRRATREVLSKLPVCGPILVSAGGGVSPDTPTGNLKVMLEEVNEFSV